MRIAITGGIGAGKSYVCGIIRKFGYDVYDCDSAAKEIMKRTDIRMRITEKLGQDTYNGDTPSKLVLTRKLLASRDNAETLNGIVHPAVAADFQESHYCIMECAILFESGFDKLVDKIICVSAPLAVRIARITARDGVSTSRAEEWIHCQMSQEEIERRSDYVIVNDGSSCLTEQTHQILTDIFKFKS